MMQTQPCDRKRIDSFLQGESVWIETDLAKHLESCDACRDYMRAQTAEPEQWSEARDLLRPTEFDIAATSELSAGGNVGAVVSSRPIQAALDLLTPSDDPHRLGRLGTYEVSGVIGAGGMGVVLKAVDPSLDRVVALKILAPSLANNETARRRFAREAKAAAAVLHANVIPIHSVASDESVPYLVMAYVRGGSLQQRIEREGALPLVEILRIGSQIASGLAAAHDQGLVHRDIKPENILLEEGVERVTITDFGLARAVDDNSVTQLGTIAGTPMYMSPEQAAGKKVNQQSDLFSLGSVLYALCTGLPPFHGDSSYGVMRKIIDESPTPVRQLNAEIPSWLEEVIEKLMAKDPAERYATAAEVHELLERCLGHVQNPAANPLPSQLGRGQSRRTWKRTWVIATAAVFLFVAMFAGFLWQAMDSKKSTQPKILKPLAGVDRYIGSMMASEHQSVFLNVGEIGEDKNYVILKPIEDGVTVEFPTYTSNAWSRRQGKYANKLKSVAKTLSLPLDETSEIERDGNVEGVKFRLQVKGEPSAVADLVEKVIVQTFDVGSSEVCRFQYSNMPSTFTSRPGAEPRTVSKDEFVKELLQSKRIYLGERKHLIFSIPSELAGERSLPWDATIWCTDIRELDPELVERIRWTQVNAVRPDVQVASYSDRRQEDQSHRWQLRLQKVAAMRIRLLHVADGELHVASENLLKGDGGSEPSEIDVVLRLEPSSDHPDSLSPDLSVSSEGWQLSRNAGEPILAEGPFEVSPVVTSGSLAWDEPTVLFHHVVFDGDLSYQRNTDSMIEASKQGATFVSVEVAWVAKGAKSTPDWATNQASRD